MSLPRYNKFWNLPMRHQIITPNPQTDSESCRQCLWMYRDKFKCVCVWVRRKGEGCNFIWAVPILLIINSLNSQALQNNFMMKCIISLQWLSIPCFDLEDSVHTIATVHEGEFGYNDGDGHLNFEGKKKHNKEIISYLKNIHHTLLYYQKRPNLNLVVELDRVKTTIESSINSLQSQ